MTCNVNSFPYGHAGCCTCERDLDLTARPASLSYQSGKLDMYFYLCSECFSGLKSAGPEACADAVKHAHKKIIAALPRKTGLAITSSLALQAHAGDLVRAYEIGVNIPYRLHEAIRAGQAEVAMVPFLDWEA
jgi:hypothetical protein